MAQLSPYPKFRAFDANGVPLAGGKLYAFAAGTSTPKSTFTDQGGGTANAHPTILDANGEADVWLDGAYKLQLDNSADVTQWTVDNITQNEFLIARTLAPAIDASGKLVEFAGTLTEAASGTHPLFAGVAFAAPTMNLDGAAVTIATSVYIENAPANGVNNYALLVDGGPVRLDGTLDVIGLTTLTGGVTGITPFADNVELRASPPPDLLFFDTGGAGAAATGLAKWFDSGAVLLAQIGFASASDGNMEITNTISGGNLELITNGGIVEITGWMKSGAPTLQASPASGDINGVRVFDDGVLLTCYPLAAAYGTLIPEDWDAYSPSGRHAPVHRFAARHDLDPDVFAQRLRARQALPAFPTREEWARDGKISLGESTQRLIETCEVLAYHVASQHQRLLELESTNY